MIDDFAVYATNDGETWALVLVTDTLKLATETAEGFAERCRDAAVRRIERGLGAYAPVTLILPGESCRDCGR
jgi:hypothetical protein